MGEHTVCSGESACHALSHGRTLVVSFVRECVLGMVALMFSDVFS